jgi:glycosyltransferase involved in cell wall biosynthesis
MKILYVVNNAAFFCSHRLPIALAARAAGHEVALATGGPGSVSMEALALRQLAELGIEHRLLAFTSTGTHPWQELAGLAQLVQQVRQWRPDIVHCASPKGLLYGGIAARLGGARGLVLAVSGMGSMATKGGAWPRRLQRRAYGTLVRLSYGHRNRRVIVQNRDDHAAVLAAGLAEPEHLVTLPGSGVHLPPYLDLDIERREPLVVLPARLLKEKGVLEFVEAARQLRRNGVTWRFALVGTADYSNPSSVREAEIAAWVREGVVEWWGHRSDIPAVLGQTRIVCMPSFYGEGMPKSLLEAAAAGCAVVTTDAVGCREAVRPGITGDLVPPRDAPALALALWRLIDDPARCLAYGQAGRAMARERFDLDAVVRRTLDLYDKLMDAGVGASQ